MSLDWEIISDTIYVQVVDEAIAFRLRYRSIPLSHCIIRDPRRDSSVVDYLRMGRF
jgi:hypothetical protein